MDITQLRYFLMTAETLNYTKAAERLFMSRQALRQALGFMEEELGMPLFSNEKNKLSLTVQGEYLQLSARAVVSAFDQMMQDVRQFSQGEVCLTIGVSVSLYPFLASEIDEIVKKFQQKYPQVKIIGKRLTNDEVIDAVTCGTVDAGMAILMKCERPEILVQSLGEYPVAISMGETYREKKQTRIHLEDLKEMTCIGMGSLEKTMKPVYEDCQAQGFLLQYEVVPDTIDAFYRITHNEAFGFDIMLNATHAVGKVVDRVLEGYTWERGVLYPQNSLEKKEIQLFYRFVEEEYRRIRMMKEM